MAHDEAISLFRYSERWISSGFVNEELLERQYRFWLTGEDPHDEHYRWGAFREWMAGRDRMTDEDLASWLAIVREEPDRQMGLSMLPVLLDTRWLSDSQFALLVAEAEGIGEPWLQKRVDRARLRRS